MKLTPLTLDLNVTRSTANDEHVFQIIPRFIIESEEITYSQNEFLPFSMGSNAEIGLILGTELMIIEMKDETITHRQKLPAAADFVRWNKRVLVLGLRDGRLMSFNPKTLELMSEEFTAKDVQISENKKYFTDGYIHFNSNNGVCEIFAINRDGKVFVFRTTVAPDNTLDYTRFEQSTFCHDEFNDPTTGSIDASREVVCSTFVGSKHIITAEDHGLIRISELYDDAFDITNQEETEMETGEDGLVSESLPVNVKPSRRYKTLCGANLLGDLGMTYRDAVVKKIERCEGLVFVLLSTGTLEILLDEELFPIDQLSGVGFIYDFDVVLRDQELCLWAVFATGENELHVGAFKSPKFENKFTIRVPESMLAITGGEEENGLNSGFLNIRFDMKPSIHDEPTALVQTTSSGWRVFQFLESSTDVTVQRLVSQGKFDQANELAQKFSIDTDIVNKARVTSYYNSFASPHSDKVHEKNFSRLVMTLSTIRDTVFVCTFCTCDSNTLISRVEWVKQLLQYGFKKAGAVAGTDCGKRLLQLIKKFYTFECVIPDPTISDWKMFCTENSSMLTWCKQFLTNGRLKDCNTVWTRHSSEFLQELGHDEIVEFFRTLFNLRLNSAESITLFISVLNDAVHVGLSTELRANAAREQLLSLIRHHVTFMESEQNWPVPGITFVGKLIDVFEGEEKKFEGMIRNERLTDTSWTSKRGFCEAMKLCLMHMRGSLEDLRELIRAHSMRVSFQKFVQDDLYGVVNAMLDELFVRDEIIDFVEGFLTAFAKSKNLSMDMLFSSHIDAVLEKVPYFANSGSIPYEERLITLAELINDTQIKLQSIYNMAQAWPVPWSDGIDSLVNKTLRMRINETEEKEEICSRLLLEIRGVKMCVPYQCVIFKYRLTASKLALDFNVWMALKRIISQRRENYIQDCLELIKRHDTCTETDVKMLNYSMILAKDGFDEVLKALNNDKPSEEVLKSFANKCIGVILRPRVRINLELQENYLKLAQIVNNRINSQSDNEILLLRELLPQFHQLSILHHEMYPFVVLELALPSLVSMGYKDAYAWCSKLAKISFQSIGEIILAFLFSVDQFALKMKDTAWKFLKLVVNMRVPLHTEEIASVVLAGLPDLLCLNPTLSTPNQVLLQEFIEYLMKFDKYSFEFAMFWKWQHLFISLRDKEIPLEQKLVGIIRGVTGIEPIRLDTLIDELTKLGTELINYGEFETVTSVINAVILNYDAISTDADTAEMIKEVISQVKDLHNHLSLQNDMVADLETDIHIKSLVQALREAEISVNGFALRKRNKTRLIGLLLDREMFRLASEVAIVFQHRDEEQWKLILNGFLKTETMENLISLLQRLNSVTELWILPEFISAWTKVSSHAPHLSHLCPVPLI